MKYIFEVDPVAKPRMTQSDKWKQREAVTRYFGFRDTIRYKSNLSGLYGLPGTLDGLVFALPMPASWSNQKKNRLRGQPHEQRPDLDNLCKGFCDVWSEDCHIHRIKDMAKIWSDFGQITLTISDPFEQTEPVDNLHHFSDNGS